MDWKIGWWIGRWQAVGAERVQYRNYRGAEDATLADIVGRSGPVYLRQIFPTREEAVAAAEKAKAKRIASLKKQIAKLEAMTF